MSYSEEDFFWSFSWSVDIPGITEDQAKELISYVKSRFGLVGNVVDPRQWLTQSFDRDTVYAMWSALEATGTDEVGSGIKEILQDWLEKSSPYEHDA